MKKYLILYIAIFITAFSVLLTMSLTVTEGEETPVRSSADVFDADETEAPAGEVLLPDSSVLLLTLCRKCGHICPAAICGEFAGASREELESAFAGWELISFSAGCAKLYHELDVCCPAHYELRLACGRFEIIRYAPKSLEPVTVMTIDADTQRVTCEEAEKLEEGLIFDTLGDIDEYLESLD